MENAANTKGTYLKEFNKYTHNCQISPVRSAFTNYIIDMELMDP